MKRVMRRLAPTRYVCPYRTHRRIHHPFAGNLPEAKNRILDKTCRAHGTGLMTPDDQAAVDSPKHYQCFMLQARYTFPTALIFPLAEGLGLLLFISR